MIAHVTKVTRVAHTHCSICNSSQAHVRWTCADRLHAGFNQARAWYTMRLTMTVSSSVTDSRLVRHRVADAHTYKSIMLSARMHSSTYPQDALFKMHAFT